MFAHQSHVQALRRKTYVVTGASSGFGKGVALELGAGGANVVLAARRDHLLEAIAKQIRHSGGNALVVKTDVSERQDVEGLGDAAVRKFGGVDVWMNNAGVGVIGRFEDAPAQDYSRSIDTNLNGVVYGSQIAVKRFKAQGNGTLVNVGSIDSEVPLAYQAVYSATKAGVLSLGRAINEEMRLGGYGNKIKVATVMPWAADTPWWGHVANYSGGTPRMAAMDDPTIVVSTILRATKHPEEEMPAGWKARGSYWSHRIIPDATERLSANIAHKWQIESAPASPPTTASLYKPMSSGSEVDDGVRARIRSEDKERLRKPVRN
jgi:short-subunit dehydrogenase